MDKKLWMAMALAAGAAGGLARSKYERGCLTVEEAHIWSQKVRKPRTLVFLTDLHDKEFGEGNVRLLEEVRRVRPDMALIGGETMNSAYSGKKRYTAAYMRTSAGCCAGMGLCICRILLRMWTKISVSAD